MTNQIKIIPADKAPERLPDTRGRPTIYPWNEMEVNEAFEVPEDKVQSVRQSVSNKNNDDSSSKKYAIAKAEDGKWYVWRDA